MKPSAILFLAVAASLVDIGNCQRRLLVESFSASNSSVTVPFNTSLQPGSDALPFDDPRVAPKVDGTSPEQIHLTYVSPSQMLVTYVTGNPIMGGNISAASATGTVPTMVRYSAQKGGPYYNTTGWSEVYQQIYTFTGFPNINYTSPLIHHALLTGLQPSTTYYYIVGEPTYGTSQELSFTTLPPVGQFPLRLGLVGDLGSTYNSSTTFDQLVANDPQMTLYVGDLTYADDYMTNGTAAPWMRNSSATPYSASVLAQHYGTFQPKWDMWGRFTEPLFSKVPFQSAIGDHEIEPQHTGEYFERCDGQQTCPSNATIIKFSSFKARYPMPNNESGSPDPSFYSFDVGGAHVIGLSSYIPFQRGSPQYQWLQNDLRQVNRTVTPWLIVLFHASWYNSYSDHYMENECMRQEIEPLLYEYGVDLAFTGHVHAYERSFPVYNFTRDTCGPVYILIGDGGNIEKIYRRFADQPGLCPQPGVQPPWQPEYCPSFPYPGGPNNGFCATSQPTWSAYREPSFGHGILVVENATHAVWEWHLNQDAADVISDRTYIVRNPEQCVGKAPKVAPAPQQPIISLRQGQAVAPAIAAAPPTSAAGVQAVVPPSVSIPLQHLQHAPMMGPAAPAPIASGG
eukprot:jgi/Botrbrau1/3925/Bobra.0365s0001.1